MRKGEHISIFTTRMNQEAIWHLHNYTCDDPIFISTSNWSQQPVKFQLATLFCKMGADTALKTTGILLMAEGTVFLYTKWVCRAFQNVCNQHLAWPGAEWHAFLSWEMSAWEFPGCISIGNGRYVFLLTRPKRNRYAFWCQKKCYVVYNPICTHWN